MRFRAATVVYCKDCNVAAPYRHGQPGALTCDRCGQSAAPGLFVTDATSAVMSADPMLAQSRTFTGYARPRR